MKHLTYILLLALVTLSCEGTTFIPKPPTYLRLELPNHTYEKYTSNCEYHFEIPEIYTVQDAPMEDGYNCHKRIHLGPLNATLFFRYWKMDQPLAFYVNNANDEVERHTLKADNILDERIIRPKENVYGTFFELQGNVATPFQFYLTDSTERFVYCEVLFNSTPNYDSLKPSLDYLKVDLKKLAASFEWK